MDTDTINHVSLCSGYGGIDLGLKRAIGRSLRTVAYVEVESFAVANLVAKASQELLDEAPVWSDLRSFPWGKFHGLVDILSGGYPCQPFSAAGKRLGAEDPRHLWPHISAGIALMRPGVCFFENVEGHISLGLSDVLQDLVGLGYKPTWCVASASECGAPHQRKRVFILAYDAHGEQRAWSLLRQNWQGSAVYLGCRSGRAEELADSQCQGLEGQHHRHASAEQAQDVGADTRTSCECGAWPSRPGEQQFAWEPPRVVVANAERSGRERRRDVRELGSAQAEESGEALQRQRNGDATDNCGAAMGNPNSPRPQERSRQRGSAIQGADADGGEAAERQTQPPLGRDADGPADWLDDAELFTTCDNRTDELRLLGNGVVPATAERAFRVLVGELMEHANP